MATLGDVASRAGVSISVASRALSATSDARVSASTRQRVRDAAAALDYQPNFAGRALQSARSNLLALIVPDLTNAIFAELMEGVEDAALSDDYTVVLGRAEDMQPGGSMLRRLIGERRVDGMLVQFRDDRTAAEVAHLAESPRPVVFINSRGPAGVSSVVLPDAAGASLATKHLIELGHRRIGMIGGRSTNDTAARRYEGFIRAHRAAGVEPQEDLVVHVGYWVDEGRAGLRALMSRAQPPTAIFVANVNAALGVIGEARSLGIRIPEDVSVVAMHDAWTAEVSGPPLTTIRMPLREMGAEAVTELLRRVREPSAAPMDVLVKAAGPTLVVRNSTQAITT